MTSHHPSLLPIEFEIGIAEIDLQHKRLYSLLERLRNVTDKHFGYAVNAILAELDLETRIHFAVEESLMRLLSFSETDANVSEHRHLTDQLKIFSQRAQDHDISDGLSNFIQLWLIDHIDKHDRELVAYFLSKGVDPVAAPKDN